MKIKPRSDKNVKGEQLYRCPFPGCGAIFAKEPGKPETCLKHRALIADVVFIMNRLKTGEPATVGGKDGKPLIYVPNPGVSMRTLEMEIAAEAAKKG